MKIIEFKEQTTVIAKDQPEYLPLPAFRAANDPSGRIVCCWKLSFWELVRLFFNDGRIWHQVLTFNQPLQPQKLTVEKPEIINAN